MDMITLALAKGYTDSKQIASVETTLTKVLEKEDGFHFDDYTPFVNVGTKCIVKFCGETYERTAFDEGDGAVGVGNPRLGSPSGVDTGEPFYISMSSGATFIFYQTGYTGVIELYVKTETIHPIDPKYLPEGGIGYAEPGKVLFSAQLDEYGNGGESGSDAPKIGLELGKLYIVTVDGTQYEIVCTDLGIGLRCLVVGNGQLMDWSSDDDGWSATGFPGNAHVTVSTPETIHTIDPKYLPPVDSITMNGADGKQYKLTVSGGALNIAEVV